MEFFNPYVMGSALQEGAQPTMAPVLVMNFGQQQVGGHNQNQHNDVRPVLKQNMFCQWFLLLAGFRSCCFVGTFTQLSVQEQSDHGD